MQTYPEAAKPQVSTRYTSHRGQSHATASTEVALVERFTGQPIADTAVHEAAHAIVAMALGVSLESVSIGLPRPRTKPSDGVPLGDYVLATIAAAGLIADRWHAPDATDLFFGPDTDEARMVASIVHTLFGGVARVEVHDGAPVLAYEGPTPTEQIDPRMVLVDVFNAVGIAAGQIIRANRFALETLASALLHGVELAGDHAREFAPTLVTFSHEQLKTIVETEALRLAEAS